MSIPSPVRKKRIILATALAGLACLAAWAAISVSSITFNGTSSSEGSVAGDDATAAGDIAGGGDAALTAKDDQPRTHIVVFRDAPLATYEGGVAGIAKPARKGNGRGRIDAASVQSRAYVAHLEQKQRGYETRIDRALGRQLKVTQRMQHALNAIVTTMSPLEAEAIGRLPEVQLVEAYREYEQDTDVGPQLVGASNVWTGISMPLGDGPDRARGEGVLVGVIDSGINFGSPSFAATDPLDGYVHSNPNGAGVYLGTCAPGGVDAGRCNDKLIGGYDFVCGAPGNSCIPSRREEPGFGDTNGHGSHTASTAAGNGRTQFFNGTSVTISGVAPRANVIAYDVCYTLISTGQGLCPNVSSAAAVNQAIIDGVDVINFSIGGGALPWDDAVSLAFLNATDAGVFVAASAGNSGPGAGTLGHVEPWVTSSAAAQHGRGAYTVLLTVTGPGTVPPALQSLVLTPGSGGAELTGPLPGTTPFIVSPGIDTTTDGCVSFAPNQFQGAIAVIRRGTCAFTVKANNAAAAGAVLVVIANNAAGGIAPSVPGAVIPAFGATQVVGNAMRDFTTANPGATASITPTVGINTVDALAGFSSRGSSGFDLLKPDITAPGVDILAAYASTLSVTDGPMVLGQISGTSMASPHTAGAAALMRQLHPSWTVPEIKSALQMTANESVLLEDQVSPADAHAAGAGRLQVDRAARAGLVLDETKARYLAANPLTGGDPSALNLASLGKSNCTGTCTFVRTVRNTLPYKHQWKLKLQGVSGTVEPAALLLKPGQSRQVLITIDTTAQAPSGNYHFGSLVMAPHNSANGNQSLPTLHMPIAVRVPVPLQNGIALTSVAGAGGSDTLYSIVVPAGQTSLVVRLAGGTGDADMYVRYGAEPSNSLFNCRPFLNGNNETCTFNSPPPGTWYIRLNGFTAYAGVTLTATHQ